MITRKLKVSFFLKELRIFTHTVVRGGKILLCERCGGILG
jgi:hypothetical protein